MCFTPKFLFLLTSYYSNLQRTKVNWITYKKDPFWVNNASTIIRHSLGFPKRNYYFFLYAHGQQFAPSPSPGLVVQTD